MKYLVIDDVALLVTVSERADDGTIREFEVINGAWTGRIKGNTLSHAMGSEEFSKLTEYDVPTEWRGGGYSRIMQQMEQLLIS
jgi:hypothetical protein